MLLLGTLQTYAKQIQRALLNRRGNRGLVESRDLRVLGLVLADVDGRQIIQQASETADGVRSSVRLVEAFFWALGERSVGATTESRNASATSFSSSSKRIGANALRMCHST